MFNSYLPALARLLIWAGLAWLVLSSDIDRETLAACALANLAVKLLEH